MCGIVGACAERNVTPILLEGLKRLEYRGYDSAGLALLQSNGEIGRVRALGKVAELAEQVKQHPLQGTTGIAHTRWATHGVPSEVNAHPHFSGNRTAATSAMSHQLALVHNGIIENHVELKKRLQIAGYLFESETDTEVIAHLIHSYLMTTDSLLSAVQAARRELVGAYSLAVIHQDSPDQLIAVRQNCPLIIGVGIEENFVASDILALLPVTQHCLYLENGDVAVIKRTDIAIYDMNDQSVTRAVHMSRITAETTDRGAYRHFMLKEIYEQPTAVRETLRAHLTDEGFSPTSFGVGSLAVFPKIKQLHIVACGTSYHAGLVGAYWLEHLAGLTCRVEVASEYRYRTIQVQPGTLFVGLSQSGETADTLAALEKAKGLPYESRLVLCNVSESAMVREADLVFLTRAGIEIGVASTKAFTTQLVALLSLTLALGTKQAAETTRALQQLPNYLEAVLAMDDAVSRVARLFQRTHSAFFIGRGIHCPIAMEGALKLKEISYIHAESYPAGELKHGALALVDEGMPVVVIAPNNSLFGKLKSNVSEVKARGGTLLIFTDTPEAWEPEEGVHLLVVPKVPDILTPIVYTLPLQLLAYHVAILKGTDIDQPRNLAKSVTVE